MTRFFSADDTTLTASLTPTTLTALSFLALIPLLYLYTALSSRLGTFPSLRSQRIVLLIAHPDDEAMFLSPTVTRLTDPALGNHLKILCLSVGNADGLGKVRRGELYKSAEMLGVRSEKDVLVVDDEVNLPDSMDKKWDEKMIAELLMKVFAPTMVGGGKGGAGAGAKGKGKAGTSAKGEKPEAGIDVIITFDKHGVSGHPNHIACHDAAVEFVNALMAGREGWSCPVDVYALTSVPIWRKYAGVLDCLFTIFSVMGALIMRGTKKGKGRKKELEKERPVVLMFVSTPGEWWRGIKAMTRAHISQMRWFRWGWIGLSRYMVINDLRRVTK